MLRNSSATLNQISVLPGRPRTSRAQGNSVFDDDHFSCTMEVKALCERLAQGRPRMRDLCDELKPGSWVETEGSAHDSEGAVRGYRNRVNGLLCVVLIRSPFSTGLTSTLTIVVVKAVTRRRPESYETTTYLLLQISFLSTPYGRRTMKGNFIKPARDFVVQPGMMTSCMPDRPLLS